MQHSQGTLKLWFDFLQLAIRAGVPINEAYYLPWGAKNEIASISFNKWWRERGRDLFAPDKTKRAKAVTVEGNGAGWVLVRIPTDLPMAIINRSVGKIVTGTRTFKHTRSFSAFAATGQVNYKTLAAYKRYLEIDLDPRYRGKTVAEKIGLLKQVYQRIHDRMKKQRQTLRAKGKKEIAARFPSHEPDVFETTDRESNLKLTGFSVKKAHRWSVSGRLVLLNVAQGEFPGRGYFGKKIAKTLRAREKELGLGKTVAPRGPRLRSKGGSKQTG